MGYGVYEDPGHDRWAGYMVPGVCDHPDCETEIFRGLDWKCEEHIEETATGDERELEGCGLFFCSAHQHPTSDHDTAKPKPDTGRWMAWQLVEESWTRWRTENPERVTKMRELVTEADLEWARSAAAGEAIAHETGEADPGLLLILLVGLLAVLGGGGLLAFAGVLG